MTYFAHSPRDNVPPQEYVTHIPAVKSRALKYAHEVGCYSIMEAGLLSGIADMGAMFHDLGKLHDVNQEVLSGKKKSKALPKNHVDAGVAHFLRDESLSPLAAALIYAHHIGFPDFAEEANRGDDAFRDDDLMAETDELLPKFEKIHSDLMPSSLFVKADEIKGDMSVSLRMLLSCISDADHTDTAMNYGNYPAKEKQIQLQPRERLAMLDQYVDTLGDEDERSVLRSEMYKACRDAVVEQNISSCDSPVGSGKTTAVMAHLLAQAEKRGLRRIFVILPYTSIIKQSVNTYRKALVLPDENPEDVVAELHHRAEFENDDVKHLTALWRAPIVVTTAVAFFETLASNTPATLRRLHELPGSAIFVDESHAALPAKLLPLAWRWMNIYANEWGCYWTLTSGSLNRFWEIPEISQEATNIHVSEIVNDYLRGKLNAYEKNRIVYRSDLRRKNVRELIDWVSGSPGPRLVILNTVQSAAVLADAFEKRFGRKYVEHLSTALTPIDRENTLERVYARLETKDDMDWVFIATSCVEAGVDLSFRTGFRELASLISLLQTAGRVNRNGKHINAEMWTFCLEFNYMLKENPGMKYSSDILRKYIECGSEISANLSTQSIADEIRLNGVSSEYVELLKHEKINSFKTIEKNFRVIDSDTRITVVDEKIISRLKYNRVDWQELQKNSVQIAHYKLKEFGTKEILPGIYEWNLEYNDFLGYMVDVVRLKKFDGQAMII
jgi:CRISPR/Cas system-associated endonuclease/helicase Cas3